VETIIGFVAGYLVGSREGKAGLKRLRESWRAIRSSPEVRKLAGDAFSMAELAARKASGRGLSAAGGAVVRTVMERAASGQRREDARAA
jgi:hypothetical protein